MQGYVCVNSIYVFLIEDIEKQHPIGANNEYEYGVDEKGSQFEFHANRI
jgi:hypothetical protein